MTQKYYTYVWYREDGTPYYIGKGCRDRAYDTKKHSIKCPPRNRISIRYWDDESIALAFEMYQIDFWGRKDKGTGCLRNLSDGGEKPCSMLGRKHSEDAKRRIGISGSKARTGVKTGPHTEEWNKNISLAITGNQNRRGDHVTEDTKAKIGALAKARCINPNKGVYFVQSRNRWVVVNLDDNRKYVGCFLTQDEALKAKGASV
jgi:hypothetical protein